LFLFWEELQNGSCAKKNLKNEHDTDKEEETDVQTQGTQDETWSFRNPFSLQCPDSHDCALISL
jgi:hypothetical protein